MSKQIKRRGITELVKCWSNCSFETVSLDDAITQLQAARREAKKNGFFDLNLTLENTDAYGEGDDEVLLKGTRLETEEEATTRIEKAAKQAARDKTRKSKEKAKRQAKWEKLNKEFGGR